MGTFGDQVYSSTDLNRRSGEVLDHARKGPVTICRNREQFALLKREQASELIKAILQFGPILELIGGALSVAEGGEPPASLAWLKAFERDDLSRMVRELIGASDSALHETSNWDAVNDLVHEWRESAAVAMSGIFEEAMNSPEENLPLPDPLSVSVERDLEESRK